MRIAALVSLAALGLASQALAQEDPVPVAEFNAQLVLLDTGDLPARDEAKKKIREWIDAKRLTPEQIAEIRSRRISGDAEGIRIATELYGHYVLTLPGPKTIEDQIGVKTGSGGKFTFGGASGDATSPHYDELLRHWEQVRNAAGTADTKPPPGGGDDALTAAIKAMKAYIEGLTNAEFDTLKIAKGILSRSDILQWFTVLIPKLPDIVTEIENASGNPDPQPDPPPKHQMAPGPDQQPDTGHSFRMRIGNVLQGGEFELIQMHDFPLSAPPHGWQVVGFRYDVLADDALQIAGSVEITIRYDPPEPVGFAAGDPNELQLVRMVGGSFVWLDDLSLDTLNQRITGSYVAEPYGTVVDQFGEFAVVQPAAEVPAMSAAGRALLVGALAALGAAAAARRLRPI